MFTLNYQENRVFPGFFSWSLFLRAKGPVFQGWLEQPPERVMLLTGHRGNGLTEMMKKLIGAKSEFGVGFWRSFRVF